MGKSKPTVNYYSILNIPMTASDEEIKKAYRKLALKLHPDITGNKGADEFHLLTKAHETLSDKNKKSVYDSRLLLALGKTKKIEAKHDLAFVSAYVKKQKPGFSFPTRLPSLKVTIKRNQCATCKGYGVTFDPFNMTRACKTCKGTGRRAK